VAGPSVDGGADVGPAVGGRAADALVVSDITVGYGKADVLHQVSLRVARGGLTAVVGANGSGKTTLLKTIMGFLKPTTGSITATLAGGDPRTLTGLRPHKVARVGVALVPEGRQILRTMTVEENLELGGYASQQSQLKPLMAQMFERFPVLDERRRQRAGNLSGGEQQMLAIARGLMSRPSIMLLDEPSLGLAPLIVQDVFAMIEEVRSQGTSVLLVEQNTHAALSMADEGFVISSGRVVLSGPGRELLQSSAIQDAYLGGNVKGVT
jgi:branched-chain amino acid transport system ATP-binding protein